VPAAASASFAAAPAIAAAPGQAEPAATQTSETAPGGDMMAASRMQEIKVENSPDQKAQVLVPLAIISLALLGFRIRTRRRLFGHTAP
jgi:hypothetical protein